MFILKRNHAEIFGQNEVVTTVLFSRSIYAFIYSAKYNINVVKGNEEFIGGFICSEK